MNEKLYKFGLDPLMRLFSFVTWEWAAKLFTGRRYGLLAIDWVNIMEILEKGNYLILVRRKSHLTTHLIAFAYFLRTGRWGYWAHAVCNVESDGAFKLVEATVKGVHWSKFNQVFNCDSMVILKFKNFTQKELDKAAANILKEIGKPYDDLFNFMDDKRMSCIEVWYHMVKDLPGAEDKIRAFKGMLETGIKINPQDLYECSDFERLLEIRR